MIPRNETTTKNVKKCKQFNNTLSLITKGNIAKCVPNILTTSRFSIPSRNTRLFHRGNSRILYRRPPRRNKKIPDQKIKEYTLKSINDQIKELDLAIDKHKRYSDILKVRVYSLTNKDTCNSVDSSTNKYKKLELWMHDMKKILGEIDSYEEKLNLLHQDVIKNTDSKLDPCNTLDKKSNNTYVTFRAPCPRWYKNPLGYIECVWNDS